MNPIPARIAYPIGWFCFGGNVGLGYEALIRGHYYAFPLAVIGAIGALVMLHCTRRLERMGRA